jgi:HPt (histidine-containing phosphotransfer) domain-containing protein
MSDARDLFLEAGMNDFVAKPIEMRELHRVIKKYIQSKAPEGYLEKTRKTMAVEQAGQAVEPESKKADETAQEKAPIASAVFSTDIDTGVMTELLRQNGMLLHQNLKLIEAVFTGNAPRTSGDLFETVFRGPLSDGVEAAASQKTAGGAKAAASQQTTGGAEAPDTGQMSGNVEAADPVIPGVDVKKCVETYGGSLDIYHNILQTYFSDMKEKETVLPALVEQRDTENFTIQVHAVKSASRGAGAFDLGEEAWELEQAGKAGDWDRILDRFSLFQEHLHEIVQNVGTYIREHLGKKTGEAAEQEECFDPALVERLKAAVEEMDYLEAESALKQLREKTYPDALEEKLEQLLECCRMFDYEQLDALVMKI